METRFHVHFYVEFVFIYVPGNRDKEIIEKKEEDIDLYQSYKYSDSIVEHITSHRGI